MGLRHPLGKPKAIFFDMGDTLVRIVPSLTECIATACQGVGFSAAIEAIEIGLHHAWSLLGPEYASYNGAPPRSFWGRFNRAILEGMGIEEELERCLKAMETALSNWKFRPECGPEIGELLVELRARGYRLGIISNWSADLEETCRHLGLAEHFEVILASQAVGASKPNPAIFRLGLEHLGVEPQEAVHIGDTYYADVIGARQAGLLAVLLDVRGLYSQADCLRIERLGQVLELVE